MLQKFNIKSDSRHFHQEDRFSECYQHLDVKIEEFWTKPMQMPGQS